MSKTPAEITTITTTIKITIDFLRIRYLLAGGFYGWPFIRTYQPIEQSANAVRSVSIKSQP
jgi:hypothetical protein